MAIWAFMNLHFTSSTSIGNSRATVLEGIEKYGSITMTAEAMGLSFQQVWSSIQTMQGELGELIVVKRGRYGGGSELTAKGKEILTLFRRIERGFYEANAEDLKKLDELMGGASSRPQPIPPWARLEDPGNQPKKSQPKVVAVPKKQIATPRPRTPSRRKKTAAKKLNVAKS